MFAKLISILLSHVPLIAFFAALLIAALRRTPADFRERLLLWMLLLAVGIDGIWAGVFHIFFPEVASASIGWRTNPFEREIGIADLALGITAIVACWRPFAFKAAVILYAVIFYIGVSIGHILEAISAHNFAANNFGVLLAITIARAGTLGWLYVSMSEDPAATAEQAKSERHLS